MKTVDTKEYISMLRTLIEEGKQVSMIISGSSMAPFLIHARDHIYLKSPSGELRKGDIQREQIFAIIIKVKRKGKWIVPEDFQWKFFAHIWPNIIPLRRTIIKTYRFFKR